MHADNPQRRRSPDSGASRLARRGDALSPRLAALARAIPANARSVADVGYDRGNLIAHLLGERPHLAVVGVEIQPLAADRFVREHPEVARAAGPRLRLVTGDALEALAPGEVEGAVIAGVSAMTIAAMLQRAPEVLASLAWIVLCPTRFNGVVRPALTAARLFCAEEELVADRGRTYEIIVARPGGEPNPDPIAQAFGPRLVEGRHPALPAYLESVRRKMAPAFASGLSSYGPDARPSAAALGDKLALLDAAIARISPQDPE